MKRLASITAIAVGLAAPLNAQDVIELDEIIVSGGFTPVPAARYGRAVSVLTEDEIEERGSQPFRTPCAPCRALRFPATGPILPRCASAVARPATR